MTRALPANLDEAAVSVAMCTYNGAQHLCQQLESIAAQKRRISEIVICDDGSADRLPVVVRSFTATHDIAVRFEVNDRRLGVTKNFEKAISLCTGDVIFLADQDDVWHDDKVGRMLAEFADPGVGLVFCDARVVDGSGEPLGYGLWDAAWFTAAEQRQFDSGDGLAVLLRHAVAAGCTLAFRGAHKPLLLPFPDVQNAHDIWIAVLMTAITRVRPVPEKLMDYRRHDQNTIGLKRHGLLSQLRMARWQLESNAFAATADLHDAAAARLLERSDAAGTVGAVSLLREKVRHMRQRQAMSRPLVRLLPKVFREWNAGNYRRYSYGYKSVLQDLLMR
jgi:glycosyltransferase involved in cell wall biosynthesis